MQLCKLSLLVHCASFFLCILNIPIADKLESDDSSIEETEEQSKMSITAKGT